MTRTTGSMANWAMQPSAVAAGETAWPQSLPVQHWQDRAYEAVKRGIDVTLTLALLALAGPLMVLTAAAIKCTSRGPVLFRQIRAGRGGRPFVMYKFRSMFEGADQHRDALADRNELPEGPAFKLREDPRLTTVGRWLRRTSIDELPQLINVLRGQMSLVGPRPLPTAEVRTGSWSERRRLDVLPGLTCLWQIAGRSEIPYSRWMQLDLLYIENRSVLLDIEILLKTLPAVLSARGAY